MKSSDDLADSVSEKKIILMEGRYWAGSFTVFLILAVIYHHVKIGFSSNFLGFFTNLVDIVIASTGWLIISLALPVTISLVYRIMTRKPVAPIFKISFIICFSMMIMLVVTMISG